MLVHFLELALNVSMFEHKFSNSNYDFQLVLFSFFSASF